MKCRYNYVQRAKYFMTKFVAEIDNMDDMYDLIKTSILVNHYNERHTKRIKLTSGIARSVLLTSDYVVKWDRNVERAKTYGGCADEYEAYCQAEDDGFEYLFAPITPIEVRGMTFYVMPRIHQLARDVRAELRELDMYLTENEANYIYDRFEDLHDENWGFIFGSPVLIDYAMCCEPV